MKQLVFLSILTILGCKKVNDKNEKLPGQWGGVEWLIKDAPSGMEASQVNFQFNLDESYSCNFGNQKQVGKWRTDGPKLYTTENGMQEIMVKIIKLDADTLRFDMNRGGQKETMTLVRKKME